MKSYLVGLFSLLLVVNAQAITITFDYSYDQGYFDAHPVAKATLLQAAADLNAALNDVSVSANLNAVPTDSFTAYDPSLKIDATFDWYLAVSDPADPNHATNPDTPKIIDMFSLAANEFRIYVGSSSVLAGTDALGEGAPASGTGDLSTEDDPAAAAAIQAAAIYSDGIMLRGAGPTVATISDSIPLSSGTVNYTIHLGALAGFLTFDNTATWHFDSATPPGAGEYDFYTVMLHEMMHSLGFGTSVTWDSLRSGSNWNGTHVKTLTGTDGTGLLNPGGGHVADGTMSKTLAGDVTQEAVMTPGLMPGERRLITKLDVAFLQDIGYGPASAAPTPPPTPVPATPTPTPTPTATPEPDAPEQPIVAGKSKITTAKSKVLIGGTLLSEGAYVQYKIGTGPFKIAKGGSSWNIKVKLKPGKNIVTIVSFDPATGKTSAPKKIVIKRTNNS